MLRLKLMYLHVVDASSSVDEYGKLTRPGLGSPVSDVYDIEEQLTRWFTRIVEEHFDRRAVRTEFLCVQTLEHELCLSSRGSSETQRQERERSPRCPPCTIQRQSVRCGWPHPLRTCSDHDS